MPKDALGFDIVESEASKDALGFDVIEQGPSPELLAARKKTEEAGKAAQRWQSAADAANAAAHFTYNLNPLVAIPNIIVQAEKALGILPKEQRLPYHPEIPIVNVVDVKRGEQMIPGSANIPIEFPPTSDPIKQALQGAAITGLKVGSALTDPNLAVAMPAAATSTLGARALQAAIPIMLAPEIPKLGLKAGEEAAKIEQDIREGKPVDIQPFVTDITGDAATAAFATGPLARGATYGVGGRPSQIPDIIPIKEPFETKPKTFIPPEPAAEPKAIPTPSAAREIVQAGKEKVIAGGEKPVLASSEAVQSARDTIGSVRVRLQEARDRLVAGRSAPAGAAETAQQAAAETLEAGKAAPEQAADAAISRAERALSLVDTVAKNLAAKGKKTLASVNQMVGEAVANAESALKLADPYLVAKPPEQPKEQPAAIAAQESKQTPKISQINVLTGKGEAGKVGEMSTGKQLKPDVKKQIMLAEERSANALAKGNELSEKGKKNEAEKFFEKSSQWLMRANELRENPENYQPTPSKEVTPNAQEKVQRQETIEPQPPAAGEVPAAVPAKPERDWDRFNEDLIDELESFSDARGTGRRGYVLEDAATAFVDFAREDTTGKPILELFKDWSQTGEATASQKRKISEALKAMEQAETVAPPATPEAIAKELGLSFQGVYEDGQWWEFRIEDEGPAKGFSMTPKAGSTLEEIRAKKEAIIKRETEDAAKKAKQLQPAPVKPQELMTPKEMIESVPESNPMEVMRNHLKTARQAIKDGKPINAELVRKYEIIPEIVKAKTRYQYDANADTFVPSDKRIQLSPKAWSLVAKIDTGDIQQRMTGKETEEISNARREASRELEKELGIQKPVKPQEVQDAESIPSREGVPVETGQAPKESEANRGGVVEQAPPVKPEPVEPGKPPDISKPTPPQEAQVTKAKEPWEMTREEFNEDAIYHGTSNRVLDEVSKTGKVTKGDWSTDIGLARAYSASWSGSPGEYGGVIVSSKESVGAKGFKNIVRGGGKEFPVKAILRTPEEIANPHKSIVERARNEGKPVPPEVLKEYGLEGKKISGSKITEQTGVNFGMGVKTPEAAEVVKRAQSIKFEAQEKAQQKLDSMSESELRAMSEFELNDMLADVTRGPSGGRQAWKKDDFIEKLLMHKSNVVSKQPPAAEKVDVAGKIADKLEGMKFKEPGRTELQMGVLRIPAYVWNGAVNAAQAIIRGGGKLFQAVNAAIRYIRQSFRQQNKRVTDESKIRAVLEESIREFERDTPLPDFQEHSISKALFAEPFGMERLPVFGKVFSGRRRLGGDLNDAIVTYWNERQNGRAIASVLAQEYAWLNKAFKVDAEGNITNIKPFYKNASLKISDVFENLQRDFNSYELTPEQKKAYAAMRLLEEDFNRLERKYKIGGQDNETMEFDEMGLEMSDTVKDKTPYFTRIVTARPKGADELVTTGNRVGSKAYFERKRVFDTEQQGWEKGFKYETDIAKRLATRAQWLYKRMADKRLMKDPSLASRSRKQIEAAEKAKYADELATGQMTEAQIEHIADTIVKRGTVNQPAFQGKVFDAETAKVLKQAFPEHYAGWLRVASDVNNALKALWLGMDLGVGFIQGQMLIAYNPHIWAKAQMNSMRALFSKQFFPEYVRRNLEPIREMAQLGSSVGRMEEMMAGMEKGELIHRIPGVKQTLGKAIVPFARQFQTFLDTAKVEIWKGLREVTPKSEWAQTMQSIESILSSNIMERSGLGQKRAIAERALLIAPSYYRGALNLMEGILRQGRTGKISRRAISSYLIGGAIIYYAVGLGLGMTMEELDQRMNPARGDFLLWKFRHGNRTTEFGFGGVYKSLLKMTGNAVRTSIENPGNWASLSSDKNPFVRWYRSHAGPVVALTWDQASGENFMGKPVNMTDLAQIPFPMAARTALGFKTSAPFNPAETGATFIGLSSFEKPNQNISEANRIANNFLRTSNNPKFVRMYQARKDSKFPESQYKTLVEHLGRKDFPRATKEYERMVDEGIEPTDIMQYFDRYFGTVDPENPYKKTMQKPFTGSIESEILFERSLKGRNKAIVEMAKKERRDIAIAYYNMLRDMRQ